MFYAKAFEVLFHKHDAMKEQYDRKRKAGLQIDEFQQLFSTFCLNGYIQEKTEFTRAEILSIIRASIKFHGFSIKPEEFLFDIEECVCLMVREGGSYFFIHRSFQEYFSAVFLASCPEDMRSEVIDAILDRPWDNVLVMLFAMASSQLEAGWLATHLDDYLLKVGEGEAPKKVDSGSWPG